MQFACNDEDLIMRRHHTVERGRAEFARQARTGLGHLRRQMSTKACGLFFVSSQSEVNCLGR